MSKPEIDTEQMNESVVNFTPEEVEIPEDVEKFTGVRAQPSSPTSMTDDSGQTVAQAVPDDTTPVITIPADPATAHNMSTGSADDANTWLGIWILRRLKQAILWGKRVVVKN